MTFYMSSQSVRSKRKWMFFGSMLLLTLAFCLFFRISRPRDIEAYYGMANECPPVWKQFAFRRFGKGDSASKFLQQFPPADREQFGRYAVYRYREGGSNVIAFTQLAIVTRDDKLISAAAGSCTWQFSFFQTADPELDRQYSIFVKQRRKNWNLERITTLSEELKKFYSLRSRWPTNEMEFLTYVEVPRKIDSPSEIDFTLKQPKQGPIVIASTEFPDDELFVDRPANDTANKP